MSEIKIPSEVADGITLATLKDQLTYLQSEVTQHEKYGSYMHPEDYQESKVKLIPALRLLVKYFGE